MADILGPIFAIALIFGIYYFSQHIDTIGTRKVLIEETRKLEAEGKLREEEARIFEMQLEREKLHGRLLPGSVEVEYKVLEDKSEEEE